MSERVDYPVKSKVIDKLRNNVARFVKRRLGRLDSGRGVFDNSLVIFIYHEVSEQPSRFIHEHNLNVEPKLFIKQMEFIQKKFHILSPDDLEQGEYERPAAMITFDDGMKSYFKTALPIMNEREIPSINFLNMATIEGDVSWTGLISYLTRYDREFCTMIQQYDPQQVNGLDFTRYPPRVVEDYVKETAKDTLKENVDSYTGSICGPDDLESVRDNRLVYFGNHLYNHYSTTTLDEPDLLEQYHLNAQKLNDYPNSRAMFAYPFGRYNPGQTKLLMASGAEHVFYSNGGINLKVNDNLFDRIEIDKSVESYEDFAGLIRWRKLKRYLPQIKSSYFPT